MQVDLSSASRCGLPSVNWCELWILMSGFRQHVSAAVMHDPAMDEATAFLTALADRGPDEETACNGWRVRDVVAHMAAGAQEESDLIESALRGEPTRPTRPFAEREAAYRDLPYGDLLAALANEGGRLANAVDALVDSGAAVEFTGTTLTGVDFRVHSRSELALHRWDIVGDDDIGRQLLGQSVFTTHAVRVLSAMPLLQESAAARAARITDAPDDFIFRLRSPESEDVVWLLTPTPRLEMHPPADGVPVVHCSAADRLLLLWGRRPSDDRIDLSGVTASEADFIEAMLYV